jgi:hypothetical protein
MNNLKVYLVGKEISSLNRMFWLLMFSVEMDFILEWNSIYQKGYFY